MSDPFRLEGRRILVTGASSGIGWAVASLAAARGAQVLATGRNEERLQGLLAAIGGGAHRAIPADLTDAGGRERLAAEAGGLDGVVHSAGVAKTAPAKFWKEADWRALNALNHEAPLLLTRELLRAKALDDGASVVFVGSIAATRPSKGYGLYAASKGALAAGARVLALELAGRRIRVNCLSPGLVESPMTEGQSAVPDASMQAYRERYPLGTGTPGDVAAAIAFLLAPASRWMTGVDLVLDGGVSLS
jgi:NAD(P)-dependent dehydrogenase (short-subunit alcohol dehydrogenase family)